MRSEHPSPVRAGAGPLQPRSLLDTVSTGGPADAGPRGWNPHRLGHRARDGTESVDRPFANPERSSGHDAGADGGGQVREAGAGAGRADLHAASNMRRASGSSCAAPCTKSSIRVSFPRPSFPALGTTLLDPAGSAGSSRDQQGPAGPSSACGGERRSRCTTSVRLSPRGPLGRQATRPAAVSERAGLPRLQTWLLQVEDELGLQSGSRTGRMETGIRPWPSLRVRDACAAPPSWIAAGQERLSVVVFSCRNGKGDPAES